MAVDSEFQAKTYVVEYFNDLLRTKHEREIDLEDVVTISFSGRPMRRSYLMQSSIGSKRVVRYSVVHDTVRDITSITAITR